MHPWKFNSSFIGSDIRDGGHDNSCESSSRRPPDTLHELFQNRTKADKTLISVMAEMAFLSPWKQMRVSVPDNKMAGRQGIWLSPETTFCFFQQRKNLKASPSFTRGLDLYNGQDCFYIFKYIAGSHIANFFFYSLRRQNELPCTMG